MNRRLALLMLEKLGYPAQFVPDGRAVLDALRREAFDIILMDCQMPVMDGLAATRAIRADETARGASRRLHIIAMTANAMRGDREACLAAGMDDYISKPVKMEILRDALQAAARKLAGTAASAPCQPASPAATSDVAHVIDQGLRALEAEFGAEAAFELVESYLQDTPGRLAELTRPDAFADRPTAARGAHSIAGSSGIFGLTDLRQLGLELEEALNQDRLDRAREVLGALQRAFAVAVPELERGRQRLRPPA